MFRKLLCFLGATLFIGCNYQSHESVVQNEASGELECSNPDQIACKIVGAYGTFIEDSFEREDVFDNSIPHQLFGWRKIINDNGTIIDGQAGNNVNMEIYSEQQMGSASHGERALYNFGRQGRSVHNLYLISKTFDINSLVEGNTTIIEFDYLTMNLDNENEYLRLEVCNDRAENCGVGEELTLEGLNDDSKWKVLFEIGPDSVGENLNGKNHVLDDWRTQKVVMFLEDFQKKEFVFRFNSRMDEGFLGNDHSNGMEDGVALDRIRATAYKIDDDVVDEMEEPDDILDIPNEPPENF